VVSKGVLFIATLIHHFGASAMYIETIFSHFGPRTMDTESLAYFTHCAVRLLDTLPKQLRISRETHAAFIAGGIGEQCVQIVHVRLPTSANV
jgi:hypothetical protein